MSVSRFLSGAVVSAVVWTGSFTGIGYLLTHGVAGWIERGKPLAIFVMSSPDDARFGSGRSRLAPRLRGRRAGVDMSRSGRSRW